ncbi:hypothetical protein OPT61_g2531 [Boeremia exigua]|uniref:Uncharacterized protein n=1 Tax=Boeremia exigua TaxID=749465 RepID=A0ACC2IL80_9PLEO|nr:hypothetical protein OPT61_g2531 [Boeremia exigua]
MVLSAEEACVVFGRKGQRRGGRVWVEGVQQVVEAPLIVDKRRRAEKCSSQNRRSAVQGAFTYDTGAAVGRATRFVPAIRAVIVHTLSLRRHQPAATPVCNASAATAHQYRGRPSV